MINNALAKVGSKGAESKTFLPADYVRSKHESRANIFILLMFAVVMLGVVSAFFVMKGAAMSVQSSFERVSAEYEQESQKIQQLRDLEATINAADCDAVVIGTPIDLARIIDIKKPNTRVYYDLQEIGSPNLESILSAFVSEHSLA